METKNDCMQEPLQILDCKSSEPFKFDLHEGEVKHTFVLATTRQGMGVSTTFNPLLDANDNIDAVMVFLFVAAGIDVAEGVKTTAREVLQPLAEAKRNLSMLEAVEAFEQVPALHEFAAKLREATLPGAFKQYFSLDEYYKLPHVDLPSGPTKIRNHFLRK